MDTLFSEFISNINKEVNMAKEILELSKFKTEKLKEQDVQELNSIIQAEETFVLTFGNIIKKREEYLEEILNLIGVEKQSADVSEIVNFVPQKYRKDLIQYQQKMQNIIEEQKKINELNAHLIKDNLEYINYMINMSTGDSTASVSYGHKGNASTNSYSKSLIDSKV